MIQTTWQQVATHILLALGVSALVIALLVHSSLTATDAALLPRLIEVLTSVSGGSLLLYGVAITFRAVMQALRYGLLLRTMEPASPGFSHLLLVAMSRNMFVDMLPARLGELSYVAMLNRGHAVGMASCLSSLAISFTFDLGALAILISAIVLYQLAAHGLQLWIVGALLMVGLVFALLLLFLFPGLRGVVRILDRRIGDFPGRGGRLVARLRGFLQDTVAVLRRTREAGITGRLILLSLGVRIGKYLAFYALFHGIVTVHFPQVDHHLAPALIALISAEAGTSLPAPSFMGFGAYEAAGMLAMVALGSDRAASLIIMLCLHVLSQIIDYGMGGLALIAFLMTTSRAAVPPLPSARSRFSWYSLAAVLLFCAGGLFLVREMGGIRKLGALKPPERGQEVVLPAAEIEAERAALAPLSGVVVWSSNRSGNHDIWMLSLPGRELKQLTTHPHTEYYPRISPDGARVVFARSREPWVSQRNDRPWDVILLDLRTGAETRLAEYGNVPTWSADGRSVYFQRNGGQIVQLALASGKESVVLDSAHTTGLKPSAALTLQTPAVAPDGRTIAVTLRGGARATAILSLDGAARLVGNGCQITWAPDGSFLYKVDHGGKQQNAIFRLDPATLKAQLWFDAPGAYSHEYFPKLDRTGRVLVYGASAGGHEHDTADYEIFLWPVDRPTGEVVRLTHHTGNDCWPDIFLDNNKP